jgi:hypothetical protein
VTTVVCNVITAHPSQIRELISQSTSVAKTLLMAFEFYSERPCLGVRTKNGELMQEYTWFRFKRIKELAIQFGSGLRQLCSKVIVNVSN